MGATESSVLGPRGGWEGRRADEASSSRALRMNIPCWVHKRVPSGLSEGRSRISANRFTGRSRLKKLQGGPNVYITVGGTREDDPLQTLRAGTQCIERWEIILRTIAIPRVRAIKTIWEIDSCSCKDGRDLRDNKQGLGRPERLSYLYKIV